MKTYGIGGDECGKMLEKFKRKLVAIGRYHPKNGDTTLAALDASISSGVTDADAGRVKPISEVFGNLEAKVDARAG